MNENKLAWILTGSALAVLLLLMITMVILSPAVPGAQAGNDPTVSEYARLFQERNRLQARVNHCERQKEGDTPGYRRVCDETELSRLDDYRTRIKQIDAELAKLRTAP